MLVTQTDWEETHPRRGVREVPSWKAWRFLAWTGETSSFLVIPSRNLRTRPDLPEGWLVGGPEALVEAAAELEPGTFTVYVLDPADDDDAAQLCQVTGLWRMDDPATGSSCFWYATDAGGLMPCTRPAPASGGRLELVSELVFGTRGDRCS